LLLTTNNFPGFVTMHKLSRRTALQALGVSVALPWLEAMAAPLAPPKRAAFVYIPNGVRLDTWFPTTVGTNYALPASLEPLAAVRSELTVLGGLDRAFVPGTGVHAQCGACWLTSSPPTETKDGGFPTNRSLDQMLAEQIGATSALPSLELSCNDHADNKETKYFESIAWYGPGHAAAAEKDPRAVFQRLFGRPHGAAGNRSVLDVVLGESKRLQGRLGQTDRRKVDEYLDAVRAAERRIQAAEQARTPPLPATPTEPASAPRERGAYIRLMADLIALAFQQDRTRVATLVIDPERWDSPRMYHGVFEQPQNHHVLTHTKGDDAKEKVGKIDRFHVEQFAHLVQALRQIPEGTGTLLDQCAVVLGSGISDGDKHLYSDLPVLIAGRAGGALKTGFYHNYPGKVPLANLWLTLLHAFGGTHARFADSTGPLRDLRA
jgi:hypothetical protein